LVPLGFEVAGLVFLFALGGGLVVLGYYRAGSALDLFLNGIKYQGGVVCLWLILSFIGAGLASGVVTYALGEYGMDDRRAKKNYAYESSNRNVVQPTATRH
jgi:hypothetical protein